MNLGYGLPPPSPGLSLLLPALGSSELPLGLACAPQSFVASEPGWSSSSPEGHSGDSWSHWHFETVRCSLSVASALTRCGRFRIAGGLYPVSLKEVDWGVAAWAGGLREGAGPGDRIPRRSKADRRLGCLLRLLFIPTYKDWLSCIGPHFLAFYGRSSYLRICPDVALGLSPR